MGRYVPPELEGTTSANKLAGKHALGSRARKLGQGILTVRFEMPFAIWCTTCPKPSIIGQGVRFNAEKKKVGNYHSTPVYSFHMKHVACGGWIEIRTDPKNTAYVVTEGAKKRDTGVDKVKEGDIRIKTNEEMERLSNDAFAALEGMVEDKRQAVTDKSRIEDLQRAKERSWGDPGETNRRLRNTFRAERKIRQRREGLTEELKDRMSLGIHLMEETEEDRRRAGFVDFGEFGEDGAIVKAQSRPLFGDTSKSKGSLETRNKPQKATSQVEKRKEDLRREIGNNTRAILDPFLKVDKSNVSNTSTVRLVKRNRGLTEISGLAPTINRTENNNNNTMIQSPALVDYDSD